MQFTTPIPISKSNHPFDYNSRIVSLGSCFAVNISEKLNYFKFQNTVNPFGILFHPLAIEKLVSFTVSEKEFTESDIFHRNDCWHSFDAHSDLNAVDKEEILFNLNDNILIFKQELVRATHINITLGTAWVYRHLESDQIVANCHKVPQKQFSKELLSAQEIQKSIQNTLDKIRFLNPEVTVTFTVSPVRHLKDGFVENQRSKANLIASIHQIISENSTLTNYFPSYEIMMDELRDYRFYAADMIHPNQLAIDYIWERFIGANVSPETLAVMDNVASVQKRLSHRPLNPNSKPHTDFLNQLDLSISALKKQFPHIHF